MKLYVVLLFYQLFHLENLKGYEPIRAYLHVEKPPQYVESSQKGSYRKNQLLISPRLFLSNHNARIFCNLMLVLAVRMRVGFAMSGKEDLLWKIHDRLAVWSA